MPFRWKLGSDSARHKDPVFLQALREIPSRIYFIVEPVFGMLMVAALSAVSAKLIK